MRISDIKASFLIDGQALLQVTCEKGQNNAIQKVLDDFGINPCEWDMTISKAKKSRSIDANKYSWKLSDQLADKLNISKDDCHVLMLARYGQTAEDSEGNKIIFSVDSKVDVKHFYKYIDVIGTGTVNGKPFTHYRALKGSSEFDTREMSIFISGIVEECKEQGIETLTPDEIEKLNQLWRVK